MPSAMLPSLLGWHRWAIVFAAAALAVVWYTGQWGSSQPRHLHSKGPVVATSPLPPPPPSSPMDELMAEKDPFENVDDAFEPPGVDWASLPQQHPVDKYAELPAVWPKLSNIPYIQQFPHLFHFKTAEEKVVQQQRLAAVKGNFTHAWRGYREHAWLKDEVMPLSGGARDPFGGWAATLIDNLDTLYMLDMNDELQEAVRAIESIDFSNCSISAINVFETTIRHLGGFIAACELTQGVYPSLWAKMIQIAEMLYHAFDTPNRMPIARWSLTRAIEGSSQGPSPSMFLAELGSFSLEFTKLSQLTGDPKYYDAALRVADAMEQHQNLTKLPGMWPVVVNARDLDFSHNPVFTIGGMADSAYEYLPKMHILTNGATDQFRRMYDNAVGPILSHTVYRPMTPNSSDILFAGETEYIGNSTYRLNPKASHLACFGGGMIGLGSKLRNNSGEMEVARRLMEGCMWAADSMPLGIMPEVFHMVPCEDKEPCAWDEGKWREAVLKENQGFETFEQVLEYKHVPLGMSKVNDVRYILRPESIESIFYLYRLTGDQSLQERAWTMFENIASVTQTHIAHADIADVTVTPAKQLDHMESFWLSETLKYFYLIFADETEYDLNYNVFNTEAHPYRRPP